jgi:hypothetical protein
LQVAEPSKAQGLRQPNERGRRNTRDFRQGCNGIQRNVMGMLIEVVRGISLPGSQPILVFDNG